MDQSSVVRALVGDSLGFHIFFVMIGIGMPLLISIFEYIAIRNRDELLMNHVKRWFAATIIFFVAGTISGTLISVQFSLIWPHFMKIASQVVGPAFMFEGYFFLLEVVFVALYIATWGRIKPMLHWFFGLFIIIGSVGSAIVITLVVSWMNEPTGFTMVNGTVKNIDTMEALFTKTAFVTVAHSVLSYYTVITLAMAGIYAVARQRAHDIKKKKFYERIALQISIIGIIFAVATMLLGHATAVNLADKSPRKLAAYELQIKTEANAPIRIGGYYDEDSGEVKNAVRIPGLLSILSGNSTATVIKGLEGTPRNEWPPLIVHTLFDIKIGLSTLILILPLALVALYYQPIKKRFTGLRAVIWRLLPLSGIAAFIVIELGWVMAEMGRQPFVIYGIMLTKDGFTKDHSVISLGILFPIIFVIMFITTIYALIITMRRMAKEKT